MAIINLTREFYSEHTKTEWNLEQVHLKSPGTEYTGLIWKVSCDTMVGSYIDFPGHILETDDGVDGAKVDMADFWRQDTTVLHLNKPDDEPEVTADDLRNANGGSDKIFPWLLIHAISGHRNSHDAGFRSIYLGQSAVSWIIASGCKVIISDVYESRRLEGVFLRLFGAGISTICEPVNLWEIPGNYAKVSATFSRFPTKQVPVCLIAEVEP